MKKLYFIFILFVFCGISIFSDNDKQEEVDFLLFLPNSADQFVNEEQAVIQLNNLAKYLSNKNPVSGQIIVYGYAAFAPNDIDSVDLSRERAFFVINELKKRGISKDLFSEPVGYGSVYLWGNNTDEDDRKPNRRVRILLSGESPIPITPEIINAETETVIPAGVNKKQAMPEDTREKLSFNFPLWILLILPVFLLLLLLFKKKSQKPIPKKTTESVQPQIPKTETAPVQAAVTEDDSIIVVTTVNLDEEIRFCAYEYFQRRNGEEDYRDQDWYDALQEISALYTARGHSVFYDGGYWWASIKQ